ncbi:MAG: alpha/beta fold hydrolase [Alphaproteobacteria bacterium]|nr:alpha/beta fold hydrolase [Alphaproteobacteria bacterium]
MSWDDLLSRARPEPTTTISVGTNGANVVDVWAPEDGEIHPVVLMIHGGCWQKAIADRTLMNYAADALRREGFGVWNIEYRGVDEAGGGYPGTFLDAALAADALRDNAVAFDFDLSRVVAYGHSAGGHLALWLAARRNIDPASPLAAANPIPLIGVVTAGGLADLEASAPVTLPSCLARVMGKLTGDASAARQNVFSDTSPAELLPLNVQQVSVNGRRDRIAPPSLGKGYTDKATAAGDAASFALVDGGHVELVAPGTSAFDETINIIRAMVDAAE